jgi:hypothetical protein
MIRSAVGFLVLLASSGIAAAADDPTAALIQAQTALVERAREYRASLEAVRALEEAEAARTAAHARRMRALYARDLVARKEAEDAEAAAAAAEARAAETRARMAEAEALMSETLAAIELAKVPRIARDGVISTPAVIGYQGRTTIAAADVRSLSTYFLEQFGRPLPVSALGQTPAHDRLGFDHRDAMDVALHPDSEEGRSLIAYLRRERIPFLAFRGPVPGASTGAHIHIGQASPRILPVRAPAR